MLEKNLVKVHINNISSNSDIDFEEANQGELIPLTTNYPHMNAGLACLVLEEFFKLYLNNGDTLWYASIRDKSSLRNLRGIEALS